MPIQSDGYLMSTSRPDGHLQRRVGMVVTRPNESYTQADPPAPGLDTNRSKLSYTLTGRQRRRTQTRARRNFGGRIMRPIDFCDLLLENLANTLQVDLSSMSHSEAFIYSPARHSIRAVTGAPIG